MKETWFTVNGQRYRLLTLEELSFDEALEIKRLSGGMTAREVVGAVADLDPQALLALFVVSMRRIRSHASEEDLLSENLMAIVDTLEQVSEEADAGPPAQGPARQPSGPGKSGSVDSAAPRSDASESNTDGQSSETTPEPHGTRAGSAPSSAG